VGVVFDENIPGLVQHAISRRGFYPDAAVRARTVSDYLSLPVADVIFGIRRYDAFLPSVYCEALKSTRFRPFDDFLARALAPSDKPDEAAESVRDSSLALSRLNWHELVARLAAAFPDARLRVYFHEHLRGREAWLLSEVLGIPRQEITMLEEAERRGFSGRAVDQLHEIHQQRPVARADVRRAVRAFPSGPSRPQFYPWSPRESQVLGDLYRTHVAQIRADDSLSVIDLRSAR
jgi:hypothetical protein